MQKKTSIFTPTIVLLSLVSLLNDISSEMLYPILPIYLSSIGFSAFYIGLLEGFAEAVIGLSKGYFGNLSDVTANRVGFVRWGYLLSSVSRPMLALFTFPAWVFSARVMDRIGKGIRTNARDALLADESHSDHRGKVFGFHRAMDTFGAAIGPLVALIYLTFYPEHYRPLFLIAFIPAAVSLVLVWRTKQPNLKPPTPNLKPIKFFSFFGYWKKATSEYRKIVFAFLLFALFNSSDAFIILVGKHNGLSDTAIITSYIFFNLIYALFAFPFGRLADKYGMKSTFLTGLILFATAYMLFPAVNSLSYFLAAYFIYGLYMASTEGITKAWISKLCAPHEKATALGFYSSIQSLVVLSGNIIAGLIWMNVSPQMLFYVSASGALVVFVYLAFVKSKAIISGHQ